MAGGRPRTLTKEAGRDTSQPAQIAGSARNASSASTQRHVPCRTTCPEIHLHHPTERFHQAGCADAETGHIKPRNPAVG